MDFAALKYDGTLGFGVRSFDFGVLAIYFSALSCVSDNGLQHHIGVASG